jgi:hypothetical protein
MSSSLCIDKETKEDYCNCIAAATINNKNPFLMMIVHQYIRVVRNHTRNARLPKRIAVKPQRSEENVESIVRVKLFNEKGIKI